MRSTRVDVLACRELLLFGVALAMKSAPGLSTRIDGTMDRDSPAPNHDSQVRVNGNTFFPKQWAPPRREARVVAALPLCIVKADLT